MSKRARPEGTSSEAVPPHSAHMIHDCWLNAEQASAGAAAEENDLTSADYYADSYAHFGKRPHCSVLCDW